MCFTVSLRKSQKVLRNLFRFRHQTFKTGTRLWLFYSRGWYPVTHRQWFLLDLHHRSGAGFFIKAEVFGLGFFTYRRR